MSEYTGKVVVITGGARGFGRAFGEAFAAENAKVILIDLDADRVREAAETLGANAAGFHGDVADEGRMGEVMAQVANEYGGVDILINNAGLHSDAYSRPVAEMGVAKVRRLFEVNVIGVVTCTLACSPHMAGRAGACIINISSASAYLGTAYGASKLAVSGLTMTLARELAGEGIRVNAVAPGIIPTETIKNELDPSVMERIKAMQYLPGTGEERDIVEAVLFLCSSRSKFITGETLRVTGGFAAGV